MNFVAVFARAATYIESFYNRFVSAFSGKNLALRLSFWPWLGLVVLVEKEKGKSKGKKGKGKTKGKKGSKRGKGSKGKVQIVWPNKPLGK